MVEEREPEAEDEDFNEIRRRRRTERLERTKISRGMSLRTVKFGIVIFDSLWCFGVSGEEGGENLSRGLRTRSGD